MANPNKTISKLPSDAGTQLEVPALVRDLLPSFLRRPRMVAWLLCLLRPVVELNQQLQSYAQRVRVLLSYNSQTLLFEKALNDTFDPALRRIYIENNDVDVQPLFLSFKVEAQPPIPVWFEAEPDRTQRFLRFTREAVAAGFTVFVPASLLPDASDAAGTRAYYARLDAFIVRYKLATIQHTTVFF
ncbi:hypothetical protein LGH70_19475 [Hymenobacter sp. BT635]|uniref:Photolyase/cryptochrome alpha/beta domain-containing protein n=1 Tax=Hymenobacter nitidus TaxID=2880929 RepID=A0ABS8AHQ2_9BACT|nr:hypothetical protein [Hymenobacter nitidus]MCB2379786.1 hypothetical protein [Hymenobacter nitidus]